MDESDLYVKLDLAHALLLTDNFEDAKKIYLKYKNENIDDELSWIQAINDDFSLFLEHNILSDYFEQISSIFK